MSRPDTHEPLYILVARIALFAIATFLYLRVMSSAAGIWTSVASVSAGLIAAALLYQRGLRVVVVLVVSALLAVVGFFGGEGLLHLDVLVTQLGPEKTLLLSDVITFGLVGFASSFVLRTLSMRRHAFALAEVAFVAGAVVFTFIDHRNMMINRPRFLSDWSWGFGIGPSYVLGACGVAVTVAAALLFIRRQPWLKTLATMLLLMLLAYVAHAMVSKTAIKPIAATDPLGLQDKEKGRDKKGHGNGKKNPFKNDYSPPQKPHPVAVALLRDDYTPDQGVMYFRQQALSQYNGVSLIAADRAFDSDVISEFPALGQPRVAGGAIDAESHRRIPTTMFLLVDHPQPPSLGHTRKVSLVDNPNPQRFVSAYNAESYVLSVPPRRLLGRKSIPSTWDKATVEHYTKYPDDPRYLALADELVRSLDPRFASDDVAKAFAIKRFLEKNGFYTRKSQHADAADPTSSFLFGSLRGYCVHFAHAAAFMLRSQGIAARVALGYAVQTFKRAGGSSILIMSNGAHAWPEIHVDGVGWVSV